MTQRLLVAVRFRRACLLVHFCLQVTQVQLEERRCQHPHFPLRHRPLPLHRRPLRRLRALSCLLHQCCCWQKVGSLQRDVVLHRKKTGGKKPKKMPEAAAVVKAGAPASNPPTPLQLLNSECQRRRVSLDDNTFFAGYCFFEAFGVSSNITLAFGEGNGAVLIRRSIAFGYEQQKK